MSAIETIQFNETGMVPAIAQDHITGEILMMAWMNKEALSLSIETQQAVYLSLKHIRRCRRPLTCEQRWC